MKKLILIFYVFFGWSLVFADIPSTKIITDTEIRYQLYPTQNMWTFLKLDTLTGQIWQVQFSIEGDAYRFETVLSSKDITDELKLEKIVGRYILYPTQNTYNFILLDQITGYTYQVQWNRDIENRVVIPIY
ncbi:MAG: hypothetical protein J6R03_06645 [Treponema sp.]|jgi:hypothetical protein|nr:hypothetical protein [Treponema sp.]